MRCLKNDTTFLKESYKVEDDTLNDIPVSLRSSTKVSPTITYETFTKNKKIDEIYQIICGYTI